MTEKDLLELIARQVGCLTEDMVGLKEDMVGLNKDIGSLKADVDSLKADMSIVKADVSSLKDGVNELKKGQQRLEKEVKQIHCVIQDNLKPKIELLFDSYAENTARINRIEAELKRAR